MKTWPTLEIPAVPFTFEDLHLKDAMTGKKKLLTLPDAPSYIYVCGITPYDSTHIGHAATYVFFDVLHRLLRATGKPIVMIENITDIDDPLFNKANEIGRNWDELAQEQIVRFTKDMTLLRIIPPDYFVSVSESMETLLTEIGVLLESKSAYLLDGDVYFRYQSGSATDEELQIFRERGGDPDRQGKEHPLDSVLWKLTSENPSFPSPWGNGRPGWHIECVNIIKNIAEQPLLVQAGGSDLKFPHHTMSNQQFCALTGANQLAEVYFHVGMVNYQGAKMSKSLGNLVFVDDLMQQGYSAMEIRYAILMQHYSSECEWTDQLLALAQKRYQRLVSALSCEMTADASDVIQKVLDSLRNDVNTVAALDVLDEWATDTLAKNLAYSHAGVVSRCIDSLLGLGV